MALKILFRTGNTLDTITFDASVSEQHGSESTVTDHPVETGANIIDHIRDLPSTLRIEGVLVDFPLGLTRKTQATGSLQAPGAGTSATGSITDPTKGLGAAAGSLLPGFAQAAIFDRAPIVKVEPGTAAGDPRILVREADPGEGFVGRAKRILSQLEKLRTDGTLVQVQTGLRTYESMAIQSITVPRDKSVAGGFKVSIALRGVRLVESQTVAAMQPSTLRKASGKVDAGKQATSEADEKQRGKSLILKMADGIGNMINGEAPASMQKGPVQ